MKKLLMGSVVLTTFAVAITLFQMSCTKDGHAEPPTLTKEQILVQKPWKIDQLHVVLNGVYGSYYSGGANSTGVNYDNTRYTFKADGTGTYTNESGATKTTTWQFTSQDKREIKFTINGLSPDIWQMVEISGNYLHGTENFPYEGNSNNLISFRLIQIP